VGEEDVLLKLKRHAGDQVNRNSDSRCFKRG
jgi:hypothetical protein